MKLITQRDAGAGPLTSAVRRAKRSVDIVIFRFDLDALEEELEGAVTRGVVVRALMAGAGFDARAFPGKRLHVRAIVRDGRRAFVRSQSLRTLELDERRQVGLIIRDPAIVKALERTFKRDWRLTPKRAARSLGGRRHELI